MNTLGRYRRWTLPASLFTGAVASVVGAYMGYQLGLHASDDVLLDDLLADMYYADNPVDCPPCDKGIKYEWFYVEPSLDNHLWEEQHLPARQEATVDPLRLEEIKPQRSVNDEND